MRFHILHHYIVAEFFHERQKMPYLKEINLVLTKQSSDYLLKMEHSLMKKKPYATLKPLDVFSVKVRISLKDHNNNGDATRNPKKRLFLFFFETP